MSDDESETGSPAQRLAEAEKQIAIAREKLPDNDEFQADLNAAESIVSIVATSIEEDRGDGA